MSERTPEVELADHYYAVARDMRARIFCMQQTVEIIEHIADGLCEQSIKRHPLPPGGQPP